MTIRAPLVIVAGQVQQLPAGDSVSTVGSFAPGSFTIATGQYANMVSHLILTDSQRVTLAGTARLYIQG